MNLNSKQEVKMAALNSPVEINRKKVPLLKRREQGDPRRPRVLLSYRSNHLTVEVGEGETRKVFVVPSANIAWMEMV